MDISVFGLGYVGAVTAACFTEIGHRVLGVDVNPGKIAMINAGQSPIVEPGLAERVASAAAKGLMRATDDVDEAIAATEASLICVGTPSSPSGAVSLDAVDTVVQQIGRAIRNKAAPHTVVVRSTVVPGTTEQRIAPALAEAAGRPIGDRLELCFNPEFLREGSAVKDFYAPPFTITGSLTEAGYAVVEAIYAGVPSQSYRTSCALAESVKYLCNAFHALKIGFANEVGALLRSLGIDGREAMDIFCEDRILNISRAYLRPGFAFGGSCLPKDVRALTYLARSQDVSLPILEHLLASNAAHIDRGFHMIAENGRRAVALFGLAFKPATDDLRESPLVTLAERLIGRGYPIRIFDRHLELARLMGANREYIDREIPHLERLLAASPEEALAGAEIIVVGHVGREEIELIRAAHAGRPIVDLQGVAELQAAAGDAYRGICW